MLTKCFVVQYYVDTSKYEFLESGSAGSGNDNYYL